jgi:preprotein translocase subunit SecG
MLVTVLTVLHVFVCVFLILVVLLQAGKGGGMGIAFGSSGSQAVFGSSGAGNFLTRLTAICAVIFFVNSMALAYLSTQSDSSRLQKIAEQKASEAKDQAAATAKVAAALEKARAAVVKATATAAALSAVDASASAAEAGPAPAPGQQGESPKPVGAPASGTPPSP